MKMVPVKKESIGGFYKRTSNMRILDEFIEMGVPAVRLEGFTQGSAYSCSASLRKTITRNRMGGHIKVLVRKGEVYLINELVK
jgi:hypothetical protein